ncbi:MAG: hypothetical protein WAU01_03240 [Saprospiraceae bacterium]
MSDNKLNLKNSALKARVTPPDYVWDRLHAKLDSERSNNTVKLYRNISIAAVMLAVLGVLSVLTINNDAISSERESQLAKLYTSQIEEISPTDDKGLYDIPKLMALKKAYEKMGKEAL